MSDLIDEAGLTALGIAPGHYVPVVRGDRVVARNLGADSLAAWLAGEGWTVTREGSAKGFRVLETSAHPTR